MSLISAFAFNKVLRGVLAPSLVPTDHASPQLLNSKSLKSRERTSGRLSPRASTRSILKNTIQDTFGDFIIATQNSGSGSMYIIQIFSCLLGICSRSVTLIRLRSDKIVTRQPHVKLELATTPKARVRSPTSLCKDAEMRNVSAGTSTKSDSSVSSQWCLGVQRLFKSSHNPCDWSSTGRNIHSNRYFCPSPQSHQFPDL